MPTNQNIANEMKELLSDSKNRIKLDDFITEHIKKFISASSIEHFPVQGGNISKEDFLERMKHYEDLVVDLQQIIILLARWGDTEQLILLEKIFIHLSETDKGSSGLTIWIHFGWYPIQILMYSAGIAALATKRFDVLKIVLQTPVPVLSADRKRYSLVVPSATNLSGVGDAWKWIPGNERKHVPRSEHLFEILRDSLDSLLFLGGSYETLFDEFEIYFALTYSEATGRGWGPIGRFGWKHDRGIAESPFMQLLEIAKQEGGNWGPLKAGFFSGSIDKFTKITETFKEQLDRLNWY
jgi:hypothetical protein